MRSDRLLIALLAGAAVFGAGSPACADKCTSAKLKAIGKKESGLLSCQAKVAATGDSLELSACETKVMDKFAAAFAKAGACAGDQTTCENIADGCESAVSGAMTDTFPSKCEASKRKAAGKLAKGEVGCYSKAAAKGLPVDTVECVPKAQGKFSAALTKAGGCPDGGSPQSLVENNCVQPTVTTDGGGMVTDVCPTTTTSTTTSTTTTTTTTSTTTTTTVPICGAFVAAWGSPGTGDGQFINAFGLAVDGTGNVFVSDENGQRIEKFDNNGNFITKWGSSGTGEGQFTTPSGVAVDGSGNVFVSDENNHRIQKFSNTGSFLLTFGWGVADGAMAAETCTSMCQAGSSGNGDGQFAFPLGLGVDGSGHVFVADLGNTRIEEFDNNGNFITKWGSPGTGDGQFDNLLGYGVAVDGSGSVFVPDGSNNRVEKFSNTGSFLLTFGWGVADGAMAAETCTSMCQAGSGGTGDGQLTFPHGVAVDGNGNVFVVDGNDRVQEFDNNGTFITKWGSPGSSNGQFMGPQEDAVDGSGNVFVVDAQTDRVQKFACP